MGLFNRLQDEMSAREKSPGLSMTDILAMPDSSCHLVSWMIRQGQVDLETIARFLEEDEQAARSLLATLIQEGFVREIALPDKTQYRVRLARKPSHKMPSNLWKALEDKEPN